MRKLEREAATTKGARKLEFARLDRDATLRKDHLHGER